MTASCRAANAPCTPLYEPTKQHTLDAASVQVNTELTRQCTKGSALYTIDAVQGRKALHRIKAVQISFFTGTPHSSQASVAKRREGRKSWGLGSLTLADVPTGRRQRSGRASRPRRPRPSESRCGRGYKAIQLSRGWMIWVKN